MYEIPYKEIRPNSVSDNQTSGADEVMEMAKDIRRRLYASMKKAPESVDVIGVGLNKNVDKELNSYLEIYKGMTRQSVSFIIASTGARHINS